MPSTKRRDDLARLRPLHGDHRPLLGGRGQPDRQMRELGLQIILHVVQHARRTAGRGGHMETILGQAPDDAVVIDEAVFARHDAVAAAAGLQRVPGVGIEEVQELRRIRPDDLDLAERRSIEHARHCRAPSGIRG